MYTAGSQADCDVSAEEHIEAYSVPPRDPGTRTPSRPHARVTTELHGDAIQRLVRTAQSMTKAHFYSPPRNSGTPTKRVLYTANSRAGSPRSVGVSTEVLA